MLRAHAHFARTFINDIVIYSDSLEDHLGHLETIFSTFCKKNIAIAPTKSFVGYPGVELLGFHVDSFSLTTTRKKVEAFRQLVFLGTLKALEHYISATGFL